MTIRLDGRPRHPDIPRPSIPLRPTAPLPQQQPLSGPVVTERPRTRVKRGKGQRRQRTVRLPLELDACLKRVAEGMGISINEAIRAAIIVAYGGEMRRLTTA